MDEQRLIRKAVSDGSSQVARCNATAAAAALESEAIVSSNTIDDGDAVLVEAECECCGLKEECTQQYVAEVKEFYSGVWVCGLCTEAVQEKLRKQAAPSDNKSVNIQQAVKSHREFYQTFNSTRLNPKLSLTLSMRDIAKRNNERRRSNNFPMQLTRSSSCAPRID